MNEAMQIYMGGMFCGLCIAAMVYGILLLISTEFEARNDDHGHRESKFKKTDGNKGSTA